MPRSPLDDASVPLFTVGQVAEILGVQIAFLRRLDEHQVVRPARSGGGQRRYSRDQIEQVSEVVVLVDEGLTLAAVRRVFELQARVAELEAELGKARAYVAQLTRERAGDSRLF
jgi:DNA-binding transcriptional MerR regulator